MLKNKKFKKIFNLINLILIVITFYYISIWLNENSFTIRNFNYNFKLSYIVAAVVLIQIYHIVQIIGWILTYKVLDVENKFREIIQLYFWNNLYAYLPNRIFYFGGTMLMANNLDLGLKKSGIVIFVFQITILISGLICIVPYLNDFPFTDLFKPVILISLLLLLLFPIIIQYKKLTNFNQFLQLLVLKPVLWYLFIIISLISWLLYSGSIYLIFMSINNNEDLFFFKLNSIAVLSNLGGAFSFFMPGGIGISETIFTQLFNNVLSPIHILTGLVIFRLLCIISSAIMIVIIKKFNIIESKYDNFRN